MARRPAEDPFDETNDSAISVAPGVFDSSGPAEDVRAGSTNARTLGSASPTATWRASSRAFKVNFISALVVLVTVLLVLPAVISMIGMGKRDAVLAEAQTAGSVEFMFVSEQMQAARTSVSGVRSAVASSSAFVPNGSVQSMREKLDEFTQASDSNDDERAQQRADDARKQFVELYVPAFLGNIENLRGEWYGMSYDTDLRITDAVANVEAHLDVASMESLTPAVIDLANELGTARTEHFESISSYVPPVTTTEPEPTQTTAPEPTEAPVETPVETEEPVITTGPQPGEDASADADAGVDADADSSADGDSDSSGSGAAVDAAADAAADTTGGSDGSTPGTGGAGGFGGAN